MQIGFDVPLDMFHELLDGVPLPPMVEVEQHCETPPGIQDVRRAVHEALAGPGLRRLFSPGDRVAIGVGSRGIAELARIVKALVTIFRQWDLEPIVVPSMGSHGGATADGQREVLAHLGVTEEAIGAPVVSSMRTTVVGTTGDGVPVHLDEVAGNCDAIVFVARVKPHTAFRGEYESGLAKMVAIGLGKQAGAALTHARGFGEMARMVPAMAEVALAHAPIRFGLAVVENADERPFVITAVPADRILADEPALLVKAREAMPRLPFDRFDVLVIDQIGKNISGDGADPNITGRYPTPYASGGPDVNKQVVLDLDAASRGNANGIGTADFTTVRLARKMSLAQTYPNALTSTVARPVSLPMILPSDKLAMQAAILTCNAADRLATVVRIQNTLRLDRFWISESLRGAADGAAHLRPVGDAVEMRFDADGNLIDI